jgi:hypothetical protein
MKVNDVYKGLAFKVAMDAGRLAWNTSNAMSRGTKEEREIYRLSREEMESNPFSPEARLARMVQTVMEADMRGLSTKAVVEEMRKEGRHLGLVDTDVDVALGLAGDAYASMAATRNAEMFEDGIHSRLVHRALLVTAGLQGHDSMAEAEKSFLKNYANYTAAYSNNQENVERLARGEPILDNIQKQVDDEDNSQKQADEEDLFKFYQTAFDRMKISAEEKGLVSEIQDAPIKTMDASEKDESLMNDTGGASSDFVMETRAVNALNAVMDAAENLKSARFIYPKDRVEQLVNEHCTKAEDALNNLYDSLENVFSRHRHKEYARENAFDDPDMKVFATHAPKIMEAVKSLQDTLPSRGSLQLELHKTDLMFEFERIGRLSREYENQHQYDYDKVENFQSHSQSDSHDESVHAHQTLNAESMKSPQMAESNPMVTNIKDASRKLMDASEKTDSPVGRFALQKVSRALNDIGDGILHHVKDIATQWAQKIPDMEASVQKFAPKPLQSALSSVFAGIREHFGMDVAESKLAESSATENRGAGNKSGPSPFD